MKKIILLSAMAVMLTAAGANAQVFSTFSIGLGAGTDGASIEVGTVLGAHFQLRAGYSYAPGWPSLQVHEFSVPMHPGSEKSASVYVPFFATLHQNAGKLLVNWYPFQYSDFYVAAGAYAGDPTYLGISARNLPEDYNILGLGIGDYTVRAENGRIDALLRGNAVQPYLGIGFGTPCWDINMVSVAFDLGIRYAGNPTLLLKGTDPTGYTDWVEIPREIVSEQYQSTYDTAKSWLRFYPTASIKIYINIL